MRIPNRLLEHRVIVQARQSVGSSVGDEYDAPVRRRSITKDATKRVVDQRMDSDTKGEEILSSAHILLQPEHMVAPGSLVTVWPGRPNERTGVVVATALGEHSIAPESAQLWLV